ncbi:MAG: glycerol-3-phosphate 1-O-acyltransferase PlsY [Desulfovibrionaceae bacterium]
MAELLWIVVTYVIGSVPYGLVFGRCFCGIDPRFAGSNNVGATNVARLCGLKWGIATLVCDILKGTLPMVVALWINTDGVFLTFVGMAAVLGHIFSCFMNFKGGKAVATSIGVMLPVAFCPLLLACSLCMLVIWRSGFVSLGSLTLVVLLPILLFIFGLWKYIVLSLCIMALVIWKHSANIQRLICRTEKPWLTRKTAK